MFYFDSNIINKKLQGYNRLLLLAHADTLFTFAGILTARTYM